MDEEFAALLAEHPAPWSREGRVVFDATGAVVIGETCGAPSTLVAEWITHTVNTKHSGAIMEKLIIASTTPAEDIPQELLDAALEVAEGWYQDSRIDWDDLWDRIDGMELADGRILEIAVLYGSAIKAIKKYVNDARKA